MKNEHFKVTINGEKIDTSPVDNDLLSFTHYGYFNADTHQQVSPHLIPVAIYNADGTTTYFPQACVIVG